jgi:hypothetical protein
MTVEQSGEEGSPGTSGHSTPEPVTTDSGTGAGKPEIDDVKRKFREALERKREQHAHANADGTQATGKVHDAHGPASSRRSFRRKSGS